jgi:acetyl esterase
MALNPALKQLIQTKLAHTQAPQSALPIADVRQAFRNLWTPAITGELVAIGRVSDITIPGTDSPLAARVYAPDNDGPCPIMLYFHGGGYVKGGIEESDAFCRNLAHVARHTVLSIVTDWHPSIPSLLRSMMRWRRLCGPVRMRSSSATRRDRWSYAAKVPAGIWPL